MDVGGVGGLGVNLGVVAALAGLAEPAAGAEAGAAVLKKALDAQAELAAQLLRSLGIGQQLDVRV